MDLGIWLFREEAFDDNANAESVEDSFRHRFRFDNADYEKLFQFLAGCRSSISCLISRSPRHFVSRSKRR